MKYNRSWEYVQVTGFRCFTGCSRQQINIPDSSSTFAKD